MENSIPKNRNIWNLVLGILFFVYGGYKLYSLSTIVQEDNTFGYIIALGFMAFGIYDLYKYYKGIK
ncbi:hypothetical protein [Gillisia sp. CAL575]|uniref:hypothetical protein n=1 Tax=Gillisia sp. CAL575 TaxID=985255 RepID=UPI00039FC7D4|nr:hypothetical protein [Gillisia sp. CAL575]